AINLNDNSVYAPNMGFNSGPGRIIRSGDRSTFEVMSPPSGGEGSSDGIWYKGNWSGNGPLGLSVTTSLALSSDGSLHAVDFANGIEVEDRNQHVIKQFDSLHGGI